MKRILFASKHQNDISGLIRGLGAFTLPEMRSHVEIVRPSSDYAWIQDWSNFAGIDCVYLCRPCTEIDMAIIHSAKTHGIPVWVDHDDDLEIVSDDNPHYDFYSREKKENIRYSIEMADIVSVQSTVHAVRLINEFKRYIHVIRGGVHDSLLKIAKPFSMSNKISWRGSESHRIDLLTFHYSMRDVCFTHPTHFFGLNPYWLSFVKPNAPYTWSPITNLFPYYHALLNRNAAFHLIPLVDIPFNHVKSNLAWQDATLAGSVCVYPEISSFKEAVGMPYHIGNLTSFKYAVDKLLGYSENQLKQLWNASRQIIEETFLTSKLNKLRIEIIKNL